MNDSVHKVVKVVDYERGKVIGVVLAFIVVAAVAGCVASVKSPITGERVDRVEFKNEVFASQAELAAMKAQIDADTQAYNVRVDKLTADMVVAEEGFVKYEQLQTGVFNIVGGVASTLATGGAIDTASIVSSLFALGGLGLGVGGLYDSNRKNKIIAEKKA